MSMMTSMAISKATQGDIGISQNKAKSLSGEQNLAKKEKELREASEGFEAIFIQKMWEEMRASMPENDMHGSKEEKYWQSMYSQQLGENMAANGGIGLADMMMDQLSKERLKSPSAANIFERTPMEVSPAPLIEDPTAPRLQMKQVAVPASEENTVHGASQVLSKNSPNNPGAQSQNINELYQSMDEAGIGRTSAVGAANVSNTNAQNIELRTAPILDKILEEAGDIGHSYYAEPYKEASAQANIKIEMASVPKASPALSQILDELEAQVNPKIIEPTIVRTTYISNLPASERKNAILDKNGKISQKHIAEVMPREDLAPIRLGNRERTMQKVSDMPAGQNGQSEQMRLGNRERTMPNGPNRQQAFGAQNINSYPESLIPTYPHQVNQAVNAKDNPKLEEAEKILNADADILAGIQSRYVSSYAPKETTATLNGEGVSSPQSNNTSVFPSYAEVQAELNSILERGTNRNVYGTMLASSTQINSPSNLLGNSFGNSQSVANAGRISGSNSINTLNNENQIPVFLTMPSLDEALASGSLIASLSPEQIRATQLEVNSTGNTIPSRTIPINSTSVFAGQKVDQRNNISDALGGPQISQPAHVLPSTKVSGLSPELNIQAPLQNGEVRSGFGWRLDPFSKERAWHTGLDIQAAAGSNVNAVHDGVVSFAGKDAELGNMVVIEHGNGMQSVYGHNAELLVKEGEKISAGTNVAMVGMSGRAAGAHLHFEIRHNGLSINPEPYLSNKKA